MGWTFTRGSRRADLIAERCETQEWTRPDGVQARDVVLKHCFRGGAYAGVFYAVHERTYSAADGKTDTHRWIAVTLMLCRRARDWGMTWGYKDMEASMGPSASSCPLSYLEMVPEPVCEPGCPRCVDDTCSKQWERNWRARVRAYWAEKAKQQSRLKGVKVGDILNLVGAKIPRVEVVGTNPLLGSYLGVTYRVPRRMVAICSAGVPR